MSETLHRAASAIEDEYALIYRKRCSTEHARRLARRVIQTVREMDGCPVCGGDCGSANPPVMHCPMRDGVIK